jgi:RNA polymerase sigma-70 factor (ECF subfamily)
MGSEIVLGGSAQALLASRAGFRAVRPIPQAGAPKSEAAGNPPLPEDASARFRVLVLPHLDAAFTFARFLTRDPVAAEDIVQEAFLRAFRGFEGYRGGAPKGWLLSIVRNCFFTFAARRRAERSLFASAEGAGEEHEHVEADIWGVTQETPEGTALRQSEAASLRELVDALPAPFREVLVLREFEELSYREIAEATGSPIGTVMSRLARARTVLGEAWRRQQACEEPLP